MKNKKEHNDNGIWAVDPGTQLETLDLDWDTDLTNWQILPGAKNTHKKRTKKKGKNNDMETIKDKAAYIVQALEVLNNSTEQGTETAALIQYTLNTARDMVEELNNDKTTGSSHQEGPRAPIS